MNKEAKLTNRESEIAELIAWGLCKKEVADRLTISPRTVENTARSIYEKIGIQKATELCVWWFCTHCGVSFDLSPIKRTIIASFILLAFVQSDILGPNDTFRLFRTRTAEARVARRGQRRTEEDFNDFFNC